MPQLKAELENFFNEQNDVKPPLSGKTLSKMSLSQNIRGDNSLSYGHSGSHAYPLGKQITKREPEREDIETDSFQKKESLPKIKPRA